MSNLSDLLPAGGGAKVITATADGNLATGQTVALQSNGTVKGVASDGTSVSENIGTAVEYASHSSTYPTYTSALYDINAGKFVIAYREGQSPNAGYVAVGTPSGSSLSFGTPVVFETGNTQYVDTAYANSLNKFLISFRDFGDNSKGKVIVGTVDGTTATFGTPADFADFNENFGRIAWSTDDNVFVVVWDDDNNDGESRVGSVSGTSITYGTEVQFFDTGGSNGVSDISITYTSNSKVVVAFIDKDDSSDGKACVGTISGTSISWGSAVDFSTGRPSETECCYDPVADRVLITYWDEDNSDYPTIVVGQISGTSITFGTPVVINSSGTSAQIPMVYNAAAGKTVIHYQQNNNSSNTFSKLVTISGTTPTLSTAINITSGDNRYNESSLAYNSTDKNVLLAYNSVASPYKSYGLIYTAAYVGSNSGDFVGITNQAINNSASGEVVVEGGVITNGSLLPLTYSGSLGTAANFIAGTNPDHVSSCFDSSSGKTIISYVGNSNYGYVVVGTPNASDNTITFGTPVAFNSSTTSTTSITYDVAQNKVLIAYSNGSNGYYIWAVVGTVSGTTVSLGTASAQTSAASSNTAGFATVYDVNAAKHVLAFQNETSSNRLDAQVMTISGTSVSSGSALTNIAGGACAFPSTAYDSSAQKVVIAYQDTGSSTHGKAVVATVSGTSISAGSEVSFNAAVTYNTVTEYDPSANKIIIAYKNNQTPTAVVGTVSGTSISFGSATVVAALSGSGFYGGTFDTTANKFIVAFLDEDDDPDNGKYAIGSVDGTNITFTTPATFNAGAGGGQLTRYISPSYNATADRTVISFQNGASSNGTSRVLQLTGATTNFTIGSTYYVQDDGTLSTTSSSVTAGKAIANTTLLLKG